MCANDIALKYNFRWKLIYWAVALRIASVKLVTQWIHRYHLPDLKAFAVALSASSLTRFEKEVQTGTALCKARRTWCWGTEHVHHRRRLPPPATLFSPGFFTRHHSSAVCGENWLHTQKKESSLKHSSLLNFVPVYLIACNSSRWPTTHPPHGQCDCLCRQFFAPFFFFLGFC